jgi:hypothetical protein
VASLRKFFLLALVAGCLYILAGAPYIPDSLLTETLGNRFVLLAFAACGMVLSATSAWRWLRFPVVLIHELGHAAAAVLLGGRAQRIVLVKDGSGHAVYQLPGQFRVLRRVPASLAGYWAPSVVACVAAIAATGGLARVLVWISALAAGGMLVLLVRSRWGAIVAGSVLLASAGAARLLPGAVLTVIVACCAGILSAGAVRSAYVQISADDIERSDAASIAAELHVPARAVAWVQLFGCSLAVVAVVFAVV